MEHASRSDEDLALALKAGRQDAFDELVRRHQGRVYAVAYRVTANREDARDVAQEAFLKVFRKIHMWQPTSGFVPWLLRMTTNQAIDALRRRKRRGQQRFDEEYLPGNGLEEIETRSTERDVRALEIDERVRDALAVLSPSQREVFVMRHYEGLPLAEIGDALGCTVGSVKVHLFRALKKMRVELEDLHDG
jgi:RNA polymerase sigma-70 factor (ECF subfamily)